MNNKIKIAAGALAALLVGLILMAFLIPRDFHYEKKTDIIAQQRMVFVFIGELKRWKEWTKWAARDPKMINTYSEPSWGVGANYHFSSWGQGEGDINVTAFTKESYMAYDLVPAGWEPLKWEFKLGPAPRQGTTVTWTVHGQYPENRFWRLIAYFLMWGLPSDMEKSLNRLKKHAELHEAYQVIGDWENPSRPKSK
jgi:hypothetical protein